MLTRKLTFNRDIDVESVDYSRIVVQQLANVGVSGHALASTFEYLNPLVEHLLIDIAQGGNPYALNL